MVSRLRRPKTKLDIQLFGGPSFHPGDTVKGRIDLYAQDSFYIREGRIQLICAHVAYDYKSDKRKLNRMVYLSESFLTDTQVFAGDAVVKEKM